MGGKHMDIGAFNPVEMHPQPCKGGLASTTCRLALDEIPVRQKDPCREFPTLLLVF